MPVSVRNPSAMNRKDLRPRATAGMTPRAASFSLGTKARGCGLASLFAACLFAACPSLAFGADPGRPDVGEAYIFNVVAEQPKGGAPAATLALAARDQAYSPQEILGPASRAWAGAQGVRLTQDRNSVLLAHNVVAYTGNGQAAAAALADGRVKVFGSQNCTDLRMPQDHPAFALALAPAGGILQAWAQGPQELVAFDLTAPGCPATLDKAPMQGATSLTVSASGAFLAAHDSTGAVWVGPRGGVLRRIASLQGAPVAIAFSEAEGALLVLDTDGRGGIWNPKSGQRLRLLQIAGGPFVRGDFHHEEARLWNADGHLVRWDVLHGQPVADETAPASDTTQIHSAGWLELRDGELSYVAEERTWRPEPVYEPRNLVLDWSVKAGCLRLGDLDGTVRYFSASTGKPQGQCFADDWTSVPISADGGANIPGLALRVFDVLPGSAQATAKSSPVNCRVISATLAFLWTASGPSLDIRAEAAPVPAKTSLGTVAEKAQARPALIPALPYRLGLAAKDPVQRILLQ